MAFEDMKAAVYALMAEISARPEDRHVLQEQMREMIAELESLGMSVPEDLRRFMEELSSEDADILFEKPPD